MPVADPLDARLLDEFQRDFPLSNRPFAALGAVFGLGEAQVLARLTRLCAAGAIARIGATVRPNTAGASTLAAMAVSEARIEAVAALVGAEPGVNHSYLRENHWNLWFVATASNPAGLADSLRRIESATGLPVLDLRLQQAFNIDLGFRLLGGRQAMGQTRAANLTALRPEDRPLLHALSQQGLGLVPQPYAVLAHRLGWTETEVTTRISALVGAGVITRHGIILRHRSLGWTANAMVVWSLPDDRITAAGTALAAHPGVTLAYRRATVPGVWDWPLYSMIHGQSREQALAVLEAAQDLPELQGAAHCVLFSTRCFKQSGARLMEAA